MLEMTKHVRDGSMNAASMRFRVFDCFIVEGYYSFDSIPESLATRPS